MAAAKSLTPTELERVLRYIAENTNAHRNRVVSGLLTASLALPTQM